jgi:hypothetical protein
VAIKKQFVKTKPVCKVTFQLQQKKQITLVVGILIIGIVLKEL